MTTSIVPEFLLHLLKCCYRFVNETWSRAPRDTSPDQGFERSLREYLRQTAVGWTISHPQEMALGENLPTASGLLHEIDIVAHHNDRASAVLELKHWSGATPTKNDVIVFFAKILDYLAANPTLMLKEVCPIFVSQSGFDEGGLGACLGLGVHPVGPGLRPLPILQDSARRMLAELQEFSPTYDPLADDLENHIAALQNLAISLNDTWLCARCGFLSETSIVIAASHCADSIQLGRDLRQVNGESSQLLVDFRELKAHSLA